MKHFVFSAVVLLSTFTLADTLDYQAAGTVQQHTAFSTGKIAAGSIWSATDRLDEVINLNTGRSIVGNLGTVTLTTGTLFSCPGGFCFKGGSVDIDSIKKSVGNFDALLTGGAITVTKGANILSFTAPFGAGGVIRLANQSFSSELLVAQRGATVPEPATLGLMGMGFVALGLVGWRKAKA